MAKTSYGCWYFAVDAAFTCLLNGIRPDVVHIGHLKRFSSAVYLHDNEEIFDSTMSVSRVRDVPGCGFDTAWPPPTAVNLSGDCTIVAMSSEMPSANSVRPT